MIDRELLRRLDGNVTTPKDGYKRTDLPGDPSTNGEISPEMEEPVLVLADEEETPKAFDTGFEHGYAKGRREGFREGRSKGRREGYREGYANGMAEGEAIWRNRTKMDDEDMAEIWQNSVDAHSATGAASSTGISSDAGGLLTTLDDGEIESIDPRVAFLCVLVAAAVVSGGD